MAFPSYSTGTVSVSAGGTVVTGVGTLWTEFNVRAGDEILIAGREVVVMDFTDSTHLVINPWQGTTVSGVAYSLIQSSPLRYNASQVMMDVSQIVAALNTDGFYFFVSAAESVPNPSYGNEGQYAMQATTGKLWIKSGGIWVFIGTNKGFGLPLPWSSVTAYNAYDTVSYGGSTYICILAHTNHTPPNATYWTLLAGIGQAATVAIGTVTTLAGGAAATVTNAGTSGAAVLNFGIPQGKTYAATSATSLAVGAGSKVFTTQAGLAYLTGARVRVSSLGSPTNWMEGVATYSGTTLTIAVDKTNGSGTFTDWNINIAGEPGAGDLSSANALSELTSVAATARGNIGLGNSATRNVGTAVSTVAAGDDARIVGAVRSDTVQSLTTAAQLQARTNIGAFGVPDVIIEDRKTSGTAGGSATGGFQKRDLNTLVRNNGSIAALASSQITLPAGSYYFSWSAPAFRCDGNITRLQNVTDAATVGFGSSEYSSTLIAGDTVQVRSTGSAVVTIAATKTFELQHRIFTVKTTNGFGVPTGLDGEIYSRIEITRFG